VKSKWVTPRAIGLHLALVAWLGLCAAAAWWQVGRAVEGNSLSFMYAIEWPVFGILGVLGWYALLNMEKVTEAKEAARREYEERMRAEAAAARAAAPAVEAEDPALAAYNDHLAELAERPKKRLFGH
jgi:DNA-binding transcriptional regulator of glucitol operon